MTQCPTVEARSMEHLRCAAFVSGDLTAIAELLDEELRYIHSNGVADTKATLLSMLSTGAVRYKHISPDIQHAVPIGDCGAVLTGILTTHAILGTETRELVGRYTSVWRKGTDAAWRLVSLQGSTMVAPDSRA